MESKRRFRFYIRSRSLTYSGGQTADPNPEANFPENTSQNAIVYGFQLETWVDEIFIDSTGLQCSDYDSLFVTIFPRPLASAIPSATDSCGPFVVNFDNTSIANNGEDISSMSFEWYGRSTYRLLHKTSHIHLKTIL